MNWTQAYSRAFRLVLAAIFFTLVFGGIGVLGYYFIASEVGSWDVNYGKVAFGVILAILAYVGVALTGIAVMLKGISDAVPDNINVRIQSLQNSPLYKKPADD